MFKIADVKDRKHKLDVGIVANAGVGGLSAGLAGVGTRRNALKITEYHPESPLSLLTKRLSSTPSLAVVRSGPAE